MKVPVHLLAIFLLCVLSKQAQAHPVELIHAESTTRSSIPGVGDGDHFFYVVVDNLAYQKEFVVHARHGWKADGNGAYWSDMTTRSTLVQTLGGNREMWKLAVPVPPNSDSGNIFQFAIRYTVNGTDYWDNNQGRNYHFGSPPPFPPTLVLGEQRNIAKTTALLVRGGESATSVFVRGQLAVRDLSFEKSILVFYTTDKWATVQSTEATYLVDSNHNQQNGTQRWGFSFTDTQSETGPIEYVIHYQVAGAEFWDNNFGANHRLE